MLAPNRLLNRRYRIEKLIGRGGMGAVYKARDERLHITVAVKEAAVTERQLLLAFEKEARRLARLRHKGLPRVWDHFVEGFGHYLVMDYIEGQDLGQKLAANNKQPFSVADVLAWADQLLAVLEYLHGQAPAIIHRDIKPPNLKLMPDGTLILLDFGLAKGGLTQHSYGSKSLFGYSAGYSPPEQMRNQGTDARSDLYAVGATLWTLLTAQPAIDAQVREQAVKAGVGDPMRPAHELNAQVPPLIAQTLRKALALNPNQRPPSATAMRQVLQHLAKRQRREQEEAQEAHRRAEWANSQVIERPIPPSRSPPMPPLRTRSLLPSEVPVYEEDEELITSSIRRLSALNPFDYLRLLWWIFVTPQQFKAYRQQFGQQAIQPIAKLLCKCLFWSIAFLPLLAIGLRIAPLPLFFIDKVQQDFGFTVTANHYLFVTGGFFITWLRRALLADRDRVKVVREGRTLIRGVVRGVFAILNGILRWALVIGYCLLIASLTTVTMVLGSKDPEHLGGLLVVMFTVMLWPIGLTSRLGERLQEAIKSERRPAIKTLGMFWQLVAIYAFQVWFWFLGGVEFFKF